jgi:hypothetical protein
MADELLTQAEHDLIRDLGLCMVAFTCIAGAERTRDADLTEFCSIIHAAQNTVMSQAAARAYPHEYRLVGGICEPLPEENP